MAYLREEFDSIEQEYRKKNTFWRRWLAVIILFIFFFGSWGGQFITQMQVSRQEAEQHHQAFEMSDFWPEFWQSTFENWQSEWLQLATQALIIAAFADYLFRKGQEDHYKTHLLIDELRKELQDRRR
jgi:ABC-type phosphate/phosphonate transport system permease subunit